MRLSEGIDLRDPVRVYVDTLLLEDVIDAAPFSIDDLVRDTPLEAHVFSVREIIRERIGTELKRLEFEIGVQFREDPVIDTPFENDPDSFIDQILDKILSGNLDDLIFAPNFLRVKDILIGMTRRAVARVEISQNLSKAGLNSTKKNFAEFLRCEVIFALEYCLGMILRSGKKLDSEYQKFLALRSRLLKLGIIVPGVDTAMCVIEDTYRESLEVVKRVVAKGFVQIEGMFMVDFDAFVGANVESFLDFSVSI